MGSYRVCVCFTRKFRVTEAEPPSDVKQAFKKYSGNGSHMTAEQLRQFLVESQGGDATTSTISDAEHVVEQIIQNRHHHLSKFSRKTITLDDFHHYLFSPDLNPPIRSQLSSMLTLRAC